MSNYRFVIGLIISRMTLSPTQTVHRSQLPPVQRISFLSRGLIILRLIGSERFELFQYPRVNKKEHCTHLQYELEVLLPSKDIFLRILDIWLIASGRLTSLVL